MRKYYLILFFALFGQLAISQPFGNEWINYSQTYYYFPIVQKGIYRIDQTTLLNAGISLSTIDPRNIQLFGKEKELSIYIHGEQDGSFDPGDYIEFYAEGNDGKLDTLLYQGGEAAMPHTYYSLINDTCYYYLTWNSSVNNLRMQEENDTSFSSYAQQPWVWNTVYSLNTDFYVFGDVQSGASSSFYRGGEGWFSYLFDGTSNGSLTHNVPTVNPFTGPGAPDALLSASSVSNSNANSIGAPGNHHLQIYYGTSQVLGVDTVWFAYKLLKFNFQVPPTELVNLTPVRYQGVGDLGVATDYQAVGSSTIRYAMDLNFGGSSTFAFEAPFQTSQSKGHYQISNFTSTGAPYLYLLGDTVRRVNTEAFGGGYRFIIPNDPSGNNRACYLASPISVQNISTLWPVNGGGSFTNYAAQSLDSVYLIITHTTLMSSAQAYANYRSSINGGSFSTLVADVEDLYHQYGAGVRKHNIALRRFCNHMIMVQPTPPSNLFLIGKSVREATESTNGLYLGTRRDANAFNMNLVPSWGYPSSDNLITAGLGFSYMEPAIPTGRLSAFSNQSVLDYLDKVQTYEQLQDPNTPYTIQDKEWMKRVMHFGGGSSAQEQSDFAGFLQNYEQIIEDTLFGGNVITYLKQSSDPIDPVEFSEVSQMLEEGVSLMTFFGHSSVNGFDQNMDEPQNWTNYGKYPFLFGNACYTGDIHQPDSASASENFVKVAGKGVIGFLASTKLGFVGPLNQYATEFYNQISRFAYDQTVGKQIQRTIMALQPGILGFLPIENTFTQITLHGDPAIRLNTHKAPELVVRNQDIFFQPNQVTLADDSLNVNVVITNIGKATSDTILVELRREFPNGADSVYRMNLYGSYFKDTLVFRIPIMHNIAVGLNVFDVTVDIPSFVTEHYDELINNQATATLFISSNGIAPVYPFEFAIILDSITALKASTVDPLIPSGNYRFEIDTTDLFNSPMKLFQLVNGGGGVVEAMPNQWINSLGNTVTLEFTDSTVYFWRVSPDSSTFLWQESSFQYIKGKKGWGQAHFYQFEDNFYSTLNYNRSNRVWEWGPNIRRIGCTVYGNAINTTQFYNTLWTIDGNMQDYSGCGLDPAIHVAVVDPISLEAWGTYGCDPNLGGSCPTTCVMLNSDKQFGNLNDGCACRGREEFYFNFRFNTPAEVDSLVSMVENKVPNGHYILLYTWRYADYSLFTPELYNMFSNLGSDSIYPGRTNAPFIVLARKGDPSFTKEVITDDINAFISLEDSLFGFNYIGSMSSPAAGPASEWGALYWEQKALEPVTTDSSRLQLYGINWAGAETLLMDTLFNELDSVINLSGIVDANQYPYVRLRGWFTDTTLFTPAQTDRWQLLYEPAPEAAVDGSLGFYFSSLNDTLQEGQEVRMAIAVKNISSEHMDSLLVHYWVEDRNRVRHYQAYPLQDSLRAGQVLMDTVTFSTENFYGLNSLWMEVNPVPLGSPINQYHQREQYHFNNFAQIPFYVNRDNTNPILDVTFDGIHILNGDIVSSRPHILISLNDENPWLIMDEEADTAFFAIYLKDPSGNQRRVYFRNGGVQTLTWTPSTGPQGKFKIEFNPEFLIDGKYELMVQASDKSGNESGDVDYRIEFEVVMATTITEVMNWPNPFTTKTHFVFTLTGDRLPDQMKIQIMTVSGKIVKEIFMDELGPIRIGRNITEYYWDGTDTYGDRLANGVYLYRVQAIVDGEDIEKRESGADAYFRKGWGKMYLMR